MTRRDFGGAVLSFVAGAGYANQSARADAADWREQEMAIRARIRPPVFPNRDFEITKYGAKSGGEADTTEAIRKSIDACSAAGGGCVIVPRGVFLTGAIHLKAT